MECFTDTDTLHFKFRGVEVAEARDWDENTLLDLDRCRPISDVTIEYAKAGNEIPKFSYEQVAA
jgi:uncharacterized protein YuzE